MESVQQLVESSKNRPSHIFQTFVYAHIVSQDSKYNTYSIAPALLYIHRAANKDYSPIITTGEPRKEKQALTNFAELKADFERQLNAVVQELFEQDLPFDQTSEVDQCAYCDFKSLCGK